MQRAFGRGGRAHCFRVPHSMTSSKTPLGASSRASAWEWVQASLLVGNLWWTTLCLGGFLAETMAVTSTLTGLLLTVHFMERAIRANLPRLHPAGWWSLPFLAYAAVNIQW